MRCFYVSIRLWFVEVESVVEVVHERHIYLEDWTGERSGVRQSLYLG